MTAELRAGLGNHPLTTRPVTESSPNGPMVDRSDRRFSPAWPISSLSSTWRHRRLLPGAGRLSVAVALLQRGLLLSSWLTLRPSSHARPSLGRCVPQTFALKPDQARRLS